MTRQEILIEVHRHVDDFFREKWAEFCRRVEDYAGRRNALSQRARQTYSQPSANEVEQIEKAIVEAQQQLKKAKQKHHRVSVSWQQVKEKYDRIFEENRQKYQNAKKQLPPSEMPAFLKGLNRKLISHRKKLRQLKWRWQVLDEEIPRLEYQTDVTCYWPGPSDQPPDEGYVRTGGVYGALKGDAFVRFFGCTLFWKPADLVNPASWFGLTPDSPQLELSPDDQVLHDAVVLCVAHDDAVKDQGGVPRVYVQGTYDKDRQFQCDAFVFALAKRLQSPGGDQEVQLAWHEVKDHLPPPEKPAQQNDAGKEKEHESGTEPAEEPQTHGVGGRPAKKETDRRKAPKGNRGAKPKYSDGQCKRALDEYEDLRAGGKDSKGAWNIVAEHQGFPDGEAARSGCNRYKKRPQNGN